MGRRKTEILSFSVPPEMKKEFKELAQEQGIGASCPVRWCGPTETTRRRRSSDRRLQRHGALKSRDRFGNEEELFESLYLDR